MVGRLDKICKKKTESAPIRAIKSKGARYLSIKIPLSRLIQPMPQKEKGDGKKKRFSL